MKSGRILEKNLLILASAGSGKTYQLGNRVIGLVGARGVDPRRIVALTFTRKAAGEFADSVLTKLGEAVLDEDRRREVERSIGAGFDPVETMERVVRALPRFQLGTMDGFFSRVVRCFQYELGLSGGRFELIQGPQLEAAHEDILGEILGGALGDEEAEEFLHAFKRATIGREKSGVVRELGEFFARWHGRWRAGGVASIAGLSRHFGELPEVAEWEERKHALVARLRGAGGPKVIGDVLDALEAHTIGSGVAETGNKTLFPRLIEALDNEGSIAIGYRQGTIEFDAMASQQWRDLLGLLVRCELSAAVERTVAVVGLVARFDRLCEQRLRRRGRLGFDDVKVLMGEWAKSEDARLRREAVDFRLDARFDHWLLDEFQDTSRAEWRGIEPLLDEAVSDDEGSLFVVGDVKQAIYGWRGGDVGLFDELRARYGVALEEETMPDSWRSCGEVLALVNRVCGDRGTIADLFGAAVAERWRWEKHEAARGELRGEARVEVVAGGTEERRARMIELLHELGVRERGLSCGVLVRTNQQLGEVANLLREEGFDVIEEGSRRPTVDHPVGVALCELVAWLADPADGFARGVLRMSPLGEPLRARYGEEDWRVWEGLQGEVEDGGFAGMAEAAIEPLWEGLSEFGRRRAGDVIAALAAFDADGGIGAREALRRIRELEVPQAPGKAAVQVMTVHKAKGLGFDVVILPEIEDAQVPHRGKFTVAGGEGWLLQNPPGWVRDRVPELREAELRWAAEQGYEALCVLYVALTRAKRGLYVLLPEVPRTRKEAERFSSPANLVRRAVDEGDDAVLFQRGDRAWLPAAGREETQPEEPLAALAAGVPLRERSTPSGSKAESVGSTGGRAFGRAVHGAFERVGWLDEQEPELPADEGGRRVAELLDLPEVRAGFERRGRDGVLHREVAIEALVDGRWLSGVIDRLHLWRSADGEIERVEVIDFKTDAVEDERELRERYRAQMEAYREVVAGMHPRAEIALRLLAVKRGCWVELE